MRKPSIRISSGSLATYNTLTGDPSAEPFVMNALRSIQQDPARWGRSFNGPYPGGMRNDILLPGNRQLALLWNPATDPIDVMLILS